MAVSWGRRAASAVRSLRAVGAQLVGPLTYGLFSAKIPVHYTASRRGGLLGLLARPDFSGLEAMGAVSTLYSIVDLLATSTAMVPWHLVRKVRDGRGAEDERDEVTTHAAVALLNRPNPFMTRLELITRGQQHLELVGECFWVVEKAGRLPIALWPVRPDRMTEVPDREKFLLGWLYRDPDGQDISLRADEVIHIQTPDPNNVYRGISPVLSLLADLESVNAAASYTRSFFRNSARPGGVITVPNRLGDGEFDELQARWGEGHSGVSNAGRVGILENGMAWEAVASSHADMQFVELRNLSRELIREAYRVHGHMLGSSDDINLANAKAADVTFARWLSVPRLTRIQLALNEVLLPMFGETAGSVEFIYDSPVDEDTEAANKERDSRVRAACLLIDRGGDWDETLAALGLPSIPRSGVSVIGSAGAEPGSAGATRLEAVA